MLFLSFFLSPPVRIQEGAVNLTAGQVQMRKLKLKSSIGSINTDETGNVNEVVKEMRKQQHLDF